MKSKGSALGCGACRPLRCALQPPPLVYTSSSRFTFSLGHSAMHKYIYIYISRISRSLLLRSVIPASHQTNTSII